MGGGEGREGGEEKEVMGGEVGKRGRCWEERRGREGGVGRRGGEEREVMGGEEGKRGR